MNRHPPDDGLTQGTIVPFDEFLAMCSCEPLQSTGASKRWETSPKQPGSGLRDASKALVPADDEALQAIHLAENGKEAQISIAPAVIWRMSAQLPLPSGAAGQMATMGRRLR